MKLHKRPWRPPALLLTAAGLALAMVAGPMPRMDPRLSADDGPEGPRFSADGALVRPRDYREWAFVTSGLGMTYGPAGSAEGRPPRFDNVFVTRDAYRKFLESGTWPEGTMFILEVRAAEEHVSINNGGRTQGQVVAIEAAVKDRTRFNEGWGYFSFDGPDGFRDSAPALPASASCYACHRDKGAVDHTFVQFYPTLLDAARKHKTIKPDLDPARSP